MSRVRLYVPRQAIKPVITIDDKAIVHKLKDVVRRKAGDTIYVFDGNGTEYQYIVEEFQKKIIVLKQESITQTIAQAIPQIVLGIPLLSEDKTDFILQKATELGVNSFIPFSCEHSRTVVPTAKKMQRWQTIVVEAARQSDRLWLPTIQSPRSFADILTITATSKLAAVKGGKKVSTVIKDNAQDYFIVVGPEGDFSQTELQQLHQHDFQPVQLSPHTLRVETAAIIAVGLLRHVVSELDNRG